MTIRRPYDNVHGVFCDFQRSPHVVVRVLFGQMRVRRSLIMTIVDSCSVLEQASMSTVLCMDERDHVLLHHGESERADAV